VACYYNCLPISQMLGRSSSLHSEGPSEQKKKKKEVSSKRALQRSKMRAPRHKSQTMDVQECTHMSIDFGEEDVANLASSQDFVTYSDMDELDNLYQDSLSDGDQRRLHVRYPIPHLVFTFISCHDHTN
jgi:hypothetical protein